jgi:hypothetical protein
MNPAVRKFAMDELLPGFEPRLFGRSSHVLRPLLFLALLLALLLALILALPCAAQNTIPTNGGQSSTHGFHPAQDVDDMAPGGVDDPLYAERRLRQLNLAQHKSMVADTDKLLKLANELNAEIGRTNPNSLTPEQLRKVAEIEKLAHNVKDKMRMPAQGLPGFQNASPLPPITQR